MIVDKQKEYSVAGKLAEELEVMAAKVDSTPEALLESLVTQYLARHSGFASGKERRAFRRVDISIPAMLYLEEDGQSSVRYQPATIRDLSPGGIRIVCSGRKLCGRLASEYATGIEFEVIFTFSEDMTPVRFQCRAVRLEVMEDDLHIGARIIGADGDGKAVFDKIVNSGLVSSL